MLYGYRPEEIYKIFKKYCSQINYISISNIFKLIIGLVLRKKILIQGLNNGEKIEKLMKKLCLDKGIDNINEVKMPLIIPSVDLHNGKTYIFSSSSKRSTYNDNLEYINDINLPLAVRASCSYPGIFSPCKYKNTELIDRWNKRKCTMERNKSYGSR